MKIFVLAVVFAVCAAAQAASLDKSPAITLLDYYKTNKDESRIISGHLAAQGQFPWQVALSISLPGGSALCGGSLISPRWVFTVAHCVDGGTAWSAMIGGIHRNVANEPGSVVVSSRTGIKHEKYNAYLNNDIALVKLDQDVPLSDSIQTIRLPTRSESNDALVNIKATVSGWGKTSDWGGASNDLNYVQLDTIPNKEYAAVYGSLTIISSTICCKGNPEQSTCNKAITIYISHAGCITLIRLCITWRDTASHTRSVSHNMVDDILIYHPGEKVRPWTAGEDSHVVAFISLGGQRCRGWKLLVFVV